MKTQCEPNIKTQYERERNKHNTPNHLHHKEKPRRILQKPQGGKNRLRNNISKHVTFWDEPIKTSEITETLNNNYHKQITHRRGRRKNTTHLIENLKILTINTKDIKSKITSITTTLHTHNTHIAAITETHLNNDETINIQGYQWLDHNRENKKGGGIGFLIRNDIKI